MGRVAAIPSPPEWADLPLQRYLSWLEMGRRLSLHTVHAYRRDITQFLAFCDRLGRAGVGEIDRGDFRRFFASLHTRRYARSSVIRKGSAIRSFFDHLHERGEISANPVGAAPVPKAGSELPVAIPRKRLARAIEAVDGSDPVDLRDRAILELAYAAGLRVSELASLTVSQVEGRDMALISGKGGKERTVPIGAPAQRAVDRWLAEGRPALAAPGAGPGAVRGSARSKDGSSPDQADGARPAGELPPPPSATPSPPISSRGAPICAACRSCWGTPTSGPPRYTPRSVTATCAPPTAARIPAPERAGRRPSAVVAVVFSAPHPPR